MGSSFKASNSHEEAFSNTPFNMAMLYYLRLDKVLLSKDIAAMDGELIDWYNRLWVVYRNIGFKINTMGPDGEIKLTPLGKNIEGLFDQVKIKLKEVQHLYDELPDEVRKMMIGDTKDILNKIDIILWHTMSRNKMIFPRIDNTAGLDKLRQKYNLNDGDDKQ